MGLFSSIVDATTSGITNQAIKGVSDLVLNLASKSSSASDKSSDSSKTDSKTPTSTKESSFDDLLTSLLKPNSQGNVSEEALFGAVAGERVQTLIGADAAQKYKDAFAKELINFTHGGYVAYESATKAALKDLKADGTLTSEQTDKIYTESFNAAQLDENTAALWDDVGGNGDPTVAVKTTAEAIASAKVKISAMDANKDAALTLRSIDEQAAGKSGAVLASAIPVR